MNDSNEKKLDELLSKTQDPNRIKTAKEFVADKRAEEVGNAVSAEYEEAEFEVMDESCEGEGVEETCADSPSEATQTKSSI